MSTRSLTIVLLAALAGAAPVLAQDDIKTERVFNLKRTQIDTTVARAGEQSREPAYQPRIQSGHLSAAITLGFLDLNQTLLEHPQLIYKVSSDLVYFGDVALIGESAFNPVLRLGYNLTSWLTLDTAFGISVSEYRAEITNRLAIGSEEGSDEVINDPPLGEFDAEERSIITLNAGLQSLIYPLNIARPQRISRWHPYLLAGLGKSWYSLNSDYTDKTAAASTLQGGAGLRLIADNLISIRFEMVYNRTQLQFDPAAVWVTLNEGTVSVPVYERVAGVGVRAVSEFAEKTISALSWGLGFTAAF